MGRQVLEAKGRNGDEDEDIGAALGNLLAPKSETARMVFLHSEVSQHVVSQVIGQLLHLANSSAAPIHLVISTYGGSVDEMFSLYDTIKFLPCPVHTVALGKVMSAGVLLLAAGAKGKRLIGSSARIMMHPVSGGVWGNVFELENQSKEAKRIQEQMINALVRETKLSRAELDKIMNPTLEYYMMAEEAVKSGIVDKIIGVT